MKAAFVWVKINLPVRACDFAKSPFYVEAIWTGMAPCKGVILFTTLLGLILDSTGFAKPKVHAEGRFAS